jgi:homoserine kinase
VSRPKPSGQGPGERGRRSEEPPILLPALRGSILRRLRPALGAPREIRVEVPYTIANVGPGFDRAALCLDQPREQVSFLPGNSPLRVETRGDPRVPCEPDCHVSAIALRSVVRRLGSEDPGGKLVVVKSIPGGSGLGSSGASAVGGALVGAISLGASLRDPLVVEQVLRAAADGEAAAAGTSHFDNVAASLFGGFVVIESVDPLRIHRIDLSRRFAVALARPSTPLATHRSRQVVPERIDRADVVANLGAFGALILALLRRDGPSVGRSLIDRIAESYRAPLVPGFCEAIESARSAGAWGAGLSGSGPTVFALASPALALPVARAMAIALRRQGLPATPSMARPGSGARLVSRREGPTAPTDRFGSSTPIALDGCASTSRVHKAHSAAGALATGGFDGGE